MCLTEFLVQLRGAVPPSTLTQLDDHPPVAGKLVGEDFREEGAMPLSQLTHDLLRPLQLPSSYNDCTPDPLDGPVEPTLREGPITACRPDRRVAECNSAGAEGGPTTA